MKKICEDNFKENLKLLIKETKELVGEENLDIYITEKTGFGVAECKIIDNSKYEIILYNNSLDEYLLSHELLHIHARQKIDFLHSTYFTPDTIEGIVVSELNGYLDHRWIKNEQIRRGFKINEQSTFSKFIENIPSENEQGILLRGIVMMNNMVLNFPEIIDEYKDIINIKLPKTLKISKDLMKHYPKDEIIKKNQVRKISLTTLRKFNEVLIRELGGNCDFQNTIITSPVFTKSKMNKIADSLITIRPANLVIKNEKISGTLLYNRDDMQCCGVIFGRISQDHLKSLTLNQLFDGSWGRKCIIV